MTTPFERAASERKARQLVAGLAFVGILIGGWLYPPVGYFIPLCMLVGLSIAAFKGRKWCDWWCPRGSFYDAYMKEVSPSRSIPPYFRQAWFRGLSAAVLMTVMATLLIRQWPDAFRMGRVFVGMLTTTTLLGVVLALAIHPRTWCAFCPVGTLSALIGKSRDPLSIDAASCLECRLCAKVCPVQIRPYAFKHQPKAVVADGDCLKCNLCIASCPKKALSRNRHSAVRHRATR